MSAGMRWHCFRCADGWLHGWQYWPRIRWHRCSQGGPAMRCSMSSRVNCFYTWFPPRRLWPASSMWPGPKMARWMALGQEWSVPELRSSTMQKFSEASWCSKFGSDGPMFSWWSLLLALTDHLTHRLWKSIRSIDGDSVTPDPSRVVLCRVSITNPAQTKDRTMTD